MRGSVKEAPRWPSMTSSRSCGPVLDPFEYSHYRPIPTSATAESTQSCNNWDVAEGRGDPDDATADSHTRGVARAAPCRCSRQPAYLSGRQRSEHSTVQAERPHRAYAPDGSRPSFGCGDAKRWLVGTVTMASRPDADAAALPARRTHQWLGPEPERRRNCRASLPNSAADRAFRGSLGTKRSSRSSSESCCAPTTTPTIHNARP